MVLVWARVRMEMSPGDSGVASAGVVESLWCSQCRCCSRCCCCCCYRPQHHHHEPWRLLEQPS